jgi:hypothetical protein
MSNAMGLASKHIDVIWTSNQTGHAQDGRELTGHEQELLRQSLMGLYAAFMVARGDLRLEWRPNSQLHEIGEELTDRLRRVA